MSQKKMVGMFLRKSLRLLWRLVVVALQVAAAFASDKQPKSRLTAGKAQQLYEDGVMSGAELVEHIKGDTY